MRAAAVLIASTVLVACSFGENVRQVISQHYDEVTRAMQTHDLRTVSALLAKDYKAVAPTGKSIGREDILKQFQFQANSVTDLKWPRTITSFKLGKNSAVATVSGHLSAYTKGKQKRHIELVATTRDTWRKMGGKWLLASSELISNKMLMDGKPLQMRGR